MKWFIGGFVFLLMLCMGGGGRYNSHRAAVYTRQPVPSSYRVACAKRALRLSPSAGWGWRQSGCKRKAFRD